MSISVYFKILVMPHIPLRYKIAKGHGFCRIITYDFINTMLLEIYS